MAVVPEFGSVGSASTAGTATATITGLDFNAEASDRIIVVDITLEASALSVSAVTIGGVTAGYLVSPVGATRLVELWAAEVPTGTSGDVAVTLNTSTTETISVGTHSLTGADPTPTDTDSVAQEGVGSADISITALTVPSGGAAIVAWCNSTQTTACAWTGATVSHDTNTGASFRHSSASTTTSGTNTITADGATTAQSLVGVAFGPASGATTTAVDLDPASYTYTPSSLGVVTKRVVTLSPASFAYTANDLTVNVVQATTHSVELLPAAFAYTPGALEVTATGQSTADTHDGIGYGDPFRRKRRPKKGKREKAVEDLLKKLMGLVPDDPPPAIEAEAEIAQASVERLFAPTVDVTPNLEALQFAQLQLAKLEAMLNRYLEDEDDEDDLLLMAA